MSAERPYLLLTPGPLSTTRAVKEAMLQDLSTWDVDYNAVVQEVRAELVRLARADLATHAAVLMQGSGTFAVESAIGSLLPRDGRLLTLSNGAYGARIAAITERLGIAQTVIAHAETERLDPLRLAEALEREPDVTHVAFVHCETTTGLLNDVETLARTAKERGKRVILDAMSSFGGLPIDLPALGVDALISSANKCIQGVPGFGFVIASRAHLEEADGHARSVSLDLVDQYRAMEKGGGKWRFTSPTHVVLAFRQALRELELEGGVRDRHARYAGNQESLVAGMRALGFRTLLPDALHSPVITSFYDPADPSYEWQSFYDALKRRGFAIYPGKVSDAATFRIGTIGDVHAADVERLLGAIAETVQELEITVRVTTEG